MKSFRMCPLKVIPPSDLPFKLTPVCKTRITLGDHTFLGEGVAEEATSCPKGCNMWRIHIWTGW